MSFLTFCILMCDLHCLSLLATYRLKGTSSCCNTRLRGPNLSVIWSNNHDVRERFGGNFSGDENTPERKSCRDGCKSQWRHCSSHYTQVTSFHFCRPTHTPRWRGICCGDAATWLSVWLSRWCIVSKRLTVSIITRPSPDCSPAFLSFLVPNMNPIDRGIPLIEGVKWKRVCKSRKILSVNLSHSLESSCWEHSMESCASWRFMSRRS